MSARLEQHVRDFLLEQSKFTNTGILIEAPINYHSDADKIHRMQKWIDDNGFKLTGSFEYEKRLAVFTVWDREENAKRFDVFFKEGQDKDAMLFKLMFS